MLSSSFITTSNLTCCSSSHSIEQSTTQSEPSIQSELDSRSQTAFCRAHSPGGQSQAASSRADSPSLVSKQSPQYSLGEENKMAPVCQSAVDTYFRLDPVSQGQVRAGMAHRLGLSSEFDPMSLRITDDLSVLATFSDVYNDLPTEARKGNAFEFKLISLPSNASSSGASSRAPIDPSDHQTLSGETRLQSVDHVVTASSKIDRELIAKMQPQKKSKAGGGIGLSSSSSSFGQIPFDDFFLQDSSLFSRSSSRSIDSIFAKTDQKASEKELDKIVEKLIKFFKEYEYEECDLLKSEKKLFKAVISDLNTAQDKKSMLGYARALREAFATTVVPNVKLPGEVLVPSIDQLTPTEYHKRAYYLLNEVDEFRWLLEAILNVDRNADYEHSTLPLPKEIINIDHLIETGSRGFHLCPHGHPMLPKLFDVRLSSNTAFQASFRAGVEIKTSTFFPLANAVELIELIDSAKQIARTENRYLCKVHDKPYLIEIYKDGPMITSAFPVFFYKKWEVAEDCVIVEGQPPVSGVVLLDTARRALSDYIDSSANPNLPNPVRYTIGSNLVIDLAPYLPHLGVSQGIFIEFSKSVLGIDAAQDAKLQAKGRVRAQASSSSSSSSPYRGQRGGRRG